MKVGHQELHFKLALNPICPHHSCPLCYLFLSFRKTLSLTFTLRRCTAGLPAAPQRRTPSSPASGSSTSVTRRRSWSLWTLVLSFWKVRELLPLFNLSTLDDVLTWKACHSLKPVSLRSDLARKLCWFLLNSVLFFPNGMFFRMAYASTAALCLGLWFGFLC